MNPRWKDDEWRQSMRIRLDYCNVLAESVGDVNGISGENLDYMTEVGKKAHESLCRKRENGELGFMTLPDRNELLYDVRGCAKRLQKDFDAFVVIGIGGSALGNIALHTALNPPYYNELSQSERKGGLKVYFPDNIDPSLLKGLLNVLDLEKTVFNVITKSGSTAETLANFLVIREALVNTVGEEKYPEHVVVTTDPEKGLLRKLAKEEGIRSLPVPPNVGGRFSVLSPVGLLSAAVTNINVEELLAGAGFMDEICAEEDIRANPAYMNASVQYLMYQKDKYISVLMPYAQSLKGIADWYRQLWAESLGKKYSRSGSEIHVGPTPVKALGATDQHSQLQLYVEGPFDKIVTFITVDKYPETLFINCPYQDEEALNYLNHRSLNELLQTEQRATEWALTKNGRPNCKIMLPEINPFTIGQLLYMFEVQTAFAGELFDVNAFDQPGVEEGKIATYALMGRSGFERQKEKLEHNMKKQSKYII